MKKMILSSVFITVLALTSTVTKAANSNKINPWKHCGIGAMIFNENGAAAAISNIIWDLGTTAVSSNISSKDNCEGANVKTAMFIQATMSSLEQDIAIGEGDYVNAMLQLRGCSADKNNEIIKAVRKAYSNEDKVGAESLFNVLELEIENNFKSACSIA
jgi:hypothetical protein